MPSFIEKGSGPTYTELRQQMVKDFSGKASAKHLRFSEAKEKSLYVHKGMSSRWFGAAARRKQKHVAAADHIRESINREFQNIVPHMKMGDEVFRHLKTKNLNFQRDGIRLTEQVYIDKAIAVILRENAKNAKDEGQKATLNTIAAVFDQVSETPKEDYLKGVKETFKEMHEDIKERGLRRFVLSRPIDPYTYTPPLMAALNLNVKKVQIEQLMTAITGDLGKNGKALKQVLNDAKQKILTSFDPSKLSWQALIKEVITDINNLGVSTPRLDALLLAEQAKNPALTIKHKLNNYNNKLNNELNTFRQQFDLPQADMLKNNKNYSHYSKLLSKTLPNYQKEHAQNLKALDNHRQSGMQDVAQGQQLINEVNKNIAIGHSLLGQIDAMQDAIQSMLEELEDEGSEAESSQGNQNINKENSDKNLFKMNQNEPKYMAKIIDYMTKTKDLQTLKLQLDRAKIALEQHLDQTSQLMLVHGLETDNHPGQDPKIKQLLFPQHDAIHQNISPLFALTQQVSHNPTVSTVQQFNPLHQNLQGLGGFDNENDNEIDIDLNDIHNKLDSKLELLQEPKDDDQSSESASTSNSRTNSELTATDESSQTSNTTSTETSSQTSNDDDETESSEILSTQSEPIMSKKQHQKMQTETLWDSGPAKGFNADQGLVPPPNSSQGSKISDIDEDDDYPELPPE